MSEIKDTEWFKAHWSWKGWWQIKKILDETDNGKQIDIIIGLVKTGCRCGELSSLLKKNIWIDVKKNAIVCSGMLVEKKKTREVIKDINGSPILLDGEKQYVIMPKKEYRKFTFPLTEKFSDWFMQIVNAQKDPDKPVFPFNRWQCYYQLALIGARDRGLEHLKEWYKPEYRSQYFPHLFRHLRASQLCAEYSNFRNPQVLQDWFLWSDPKMPNYYIKLSMSAQFVNPKEVR
jgi:integrase